ncbi:MAG: cobyric acid synthase [Clostridia bacterium]|nr:cobyric acid synthase [Clostridia bacterium]
MAKSIMVLGTGSSVGKSIITTGLCRVLNQDGYEVAPFKSQNMALNSFITEQGDEMGRAQVVQAEAAGKKAHVNMNPILLKPSTDKKSQVILKGKVFKNMSAVEYHEYKSELKDMVKSVYDDLASENDVIVLEGAGSPAEINLRENDLVNMGMAELSDSPVVIVGDIDRGGVFASLYGTIMLLTEEERKRVKGVIINKFRGDVEILKPGIKMLEDLIHLPVLGVVPYTHLQIEDEDSLAERFYNRTQSEGQIKIEVLYLPHVSNFTDFNVFETQPDVQLRYVMRGESIGDPDILIIPGSKNTIEDLIYLRNSGLEEQIIRLSKKNKYIVGICGGYQILGESLEDPYHTESAIPSTNGLGLLATTTVFEQEKTTTQIEGVLEAEIPGRLAELSASTIKGYEIHMGQTKLKEGAKPFLTICKKLNETVAISDGAINLAGNVFGTYIHGIFDDIQFTRNFLNIIRREKGLDDVESQVKDFEAFKDNEYNKLAEVLKASLDMDKIYEIIGVK